MHCSGILFLKTDLQKHRYVPDHAVCTLLSRFSGIGIIQKYLILEIIYDNDFKYESFLLFYNFIGGGMKLIQIWCEQQIEIVPETDQFLSPLNIG